MLIFPLFSQVMSVVSIVESAFPGNNILQGLSVNLLDVWIGLSVSLNIIVTSLIVGRIMLMRRRIGSLLSPDMARMYTSVIAILVESALPFTIVGIIFLGVTVNNNDGATAMAFIWGGFTVRHSILYR